MSKAKLSLNWEIVGRRGMGSLPMLNTYQSDIGRDADGRMWMVRVEYRLQEKKFMVWFDNDSEYEVDLSDSTKYDNDGYRTSWSDPFLRPEVIYSKNYWRSHDQFYHTKMVDYENISEVIEGFVNERNLVCE